MIDVVKEEFVWEQKYRPQHVKDVIVPETIKNDILAFVEKKQIPNFLFYSPNPGSGKTTMSLAIANDLGIKPLFLNASLNNSIEDIRNMVVQYATTVSLFGGSSHKIVILDEAERLSAAALDALKGLIEEVSRNCRFIITTNAKGRIPDPLRSRCSEIDFVWSESEQTKLIMAMFHRVSQILEMEKVEYDRAVLAKIVKHYSPDNRKLLNSLQTFVSKHSKVDVGILSSLQSTDMKTLVDALKEKEFNKVLQWCADNQDGVADDIYTKLNASLRPHLEGQQYAQLLLLIGNEQKSHYSVPDKMIQVAQMCVRIMMEIKFK